MLIVRHAESLTNADTISRFNSGGPGPELSEHGRDQAHQLGEFLLSRQPELVLASPAMRAAQTWELASRSFRRPPPCIVLPGLVEMDWGSWGGQPVKQMFTPEEDERAASEGLDYRANPYAETLREVAARVQEALEPYMDYHEDIAVVSHCTAIKSYKGVPAGISRRDIKREKIPNAGVLGYDPALAGQSTLVFEPIETKQNQLIAVA